MTPFSRKREVTNRMTFDILDSLVCFPGLATDVEKVVAEEFLYRHMKC